MHVEVKVITSDGRDHGLRGEGSMVATDVLTAKFDHRPNKELRGEVGTDGHISWDNGQTRKYAGAWRASSGTGVSSDPRSEPACEPSHPQT